MRLFVAVELEEALRAQAARVGVQLADALGHSARRSVTWVAPDKMHLTLRFLGEADEKVARALAERVARPFVTPAFRLAVAGLGAFPPSGPPRVFWLGLRAGARELRQVHDEVEERLGGLGFEKEDRPFRAHLTLGRVKAPLPDARRVMSAMAVDRVGECGVSEVSLIHSRLSPRGAVYTALARGPLAQ